MIAPISFTNYSIPYAGNNSVGQAVGAISRVQRVAPVNGRTAQLVEKTNPSECQTCKERKYIDRSNDSDVSFKVPTNISPEASYAAVSGHEQQHVSNAVSEGSKEGNRLIFASVTLKMAVCPECGTPYVAGGVTRSQIAYNESNPYERARKSVESSLLKGMYVDYVA